MKLFRRNWTCPNCGRRNSWVASWCRNCSERKPRINVPPINWEVVVWIVLLAAFLFAFWFVEVL